MFVLTGILLGLSTVFFIGPVLFYILKSSVSSGKKAGIAASVGILVGDAICLSLVFFGGRELFKNSEFQWWLAFSGGSLLLVLGLKYLLSSHEETAVKERAMGSAWTIHFINGFLINFLNPFVFAVWFGFATYNRSMYSEVQTFISLLITLLVIFITDMLKSVYAVRLRNLLNKNTLALFYRIIGFGMVLFALRLFFYTYQAR